MQEEVENRTVSLIISGSKFSGRLLKSGISKYLAHRKEVKAQKSRDHPVEHGGRVSMAELQAQKGDLRRLDISDPSIKEFERIARQHEVKYSVYKVGKGKYQVFFKAPSEEAMTAAFEKYSQKKLEKANRPSVLKKLGQFKEMVKHAVVDRTKRKELER
ncbi:MAG: PcfB family protein [Eubacteriales bacterium]|nr:PcfB family protein [Eubacteriales bacterium]